MGLWEPRLAISRGWFGLGGGAGRAALGTLGCRWGAAAGWGVWSCSGAAVGGWGAGLPLQCGAQRLQPVSPSSSGKLDSAFAGEGESTSEPGSHHRLLLPLGSTSSSPWRESPGFSRLRGLCTPCPIPACRDILSVCPGDSCALRGAEPRAKGQVRSPRWHSMRWGCSHSFFSREGPALLQSMAGGSSICQTGSRASGCLTPLAMPGCCRPPRVAGGQMRWVCWGEPSCHPLRAAVATSAAVETQGGLGAASSPCPGGQEGCASPLLSLASDLCFTLSLGDAICFAAAVQCAAHCRGALPRHRQWGPPRLRHAGLVTAVRAPASLWAVAPAPAAAPGGKPQPGCPMWGECGAVLGTAPHPTGLRRWLHRTKRLVGGPGALG